MSQVLLCEARSRFSIPRFASLAAPCCVNYIKYRGKTPQKRAKCTALRFLFKGMKGTQSEHSALWERTDERSAVTSFAYVPRVGGVGGLASRFETFSYKMQILKRGFARMRTAKRTPVDRKTCYGSSNCIYIIHVHTYIERKLKLIKRKKKKTLRL